MRRAIPYILILCFLSALLVAGRFVRPGIHNITTTNTGIIYAGTVATVARDTGNTSWTNPTYAQGTADTSYTRASLAKHADGAAAESQWLRCTNFGFAIPTNAVIDGIVVTYRVVSQGTTIYQKGVYVWLKKADNTHIGENRNGDGEDNLASGPTDYAHGSSSGLWFTQLTPADINDSGFGVDISVENRYTAARYIDIDCVSIQVYYTVPTTRRDTILTGIYDVSQSKPYQLHGMCLDANYVYLAYIKSTMYAGTGVNISRISRSIDAGGIDTKNWDYGILTICYQGIAQDTDYIYADAGWLDINGWHPAIDKIKKSDFNSDDGAVEYHIEYPSASAPGCGTPQGIFLGKDYDAVDMVYFVGQGQDATTQAYLDNTGGPIYQFQRSDMSWTTNLACVEIPHTRIWFDGAVDLNDATNHYPLYLVGQDSDATHRSAKLAKIAQASGRVLSVNSWALIHNATDGSDLSTGSAFYALDIDHDTGYIWAIGYQSRSSGTEGDILLAKIQKDDGSGNHYLAITKVWKITTNYDTSFRGSGIIVDSQYVYISTWFIPHSGLGTNEAWDATGNMAYIMKLDKATLEGATPANAIIWAKGFDGYTAGSKSTGIVQLRDGGDGFLYAGIYSNAIGDAVNMCPGVLKIFKETGRSVDYKNSTNLLKERVRNGIDTLTITDITSTVTSSIVGGHAVMNNTKVPAAQTSTWATYPTMGRANKVLNVFP